MADATHVTWLKQGAEAWNRRRLQQPFIPDLSGADLSGASLWRYNLRGALFRRTDLSQATLRDAALEAADFTEANLYRADLQGATPERAVLHRATLRRSDLRRCDLRGARLDGADLTDARLDHADLRAADLRAWIAPRADAPRNAFEAAFRSEPVPIVTITAAQLTSAIGDGATLLPDGCARPEHWEGPEPEAAARLKATPAAEFGWRADGTLGASRLHPEPPRPQAPAAPVDARARDQQLATLARLADRLAVSIEAFVARAGDNRSAAAQGVIAPLKTIAEEAARPADEVLIAFIRANIAALERVRAEDLEAFEAIDKALFEQLLIEWRRLAPFFPVLAEIDNPHNADIAPDGAEATADQFVSDVMATVNSAEGQELLSPEARDVFEAEEKKPTQPGAEGKKERLVRVAALTAALGRALDDAPKPVKRVAAFTGFALTVKELLETVLWIF